MEVKLCTAEAMAMKCDTPLLYLLFIYSLVLLCAYVGSNILFTATYTYFGALILNQTQLVALNALHLSVAEPCTFHPFGFFRQTTIQHYSIL